MSLAELELFADERIARITLNHSRRRHALWIECLTNLTETLQNIAADRNANVVIIRAYDPVFSAGYDLHEVVEGDSQEVQALFQQCSETMRVIRNAPQIVIAQVSGMVTATGCQLVGASDLAVASSSAQFATPGVKIGYFSGAPAVHVTRNLPRKIAAELLLTGELLSAADALRYGMVNRVVDDGEIGEATLKFARLIARYSLPVLASGKRLLYQQMELPEDSALNYATIFMALQSASPDAKEGIQSFFAKRTPRWSDR
ncbi:MAG: enoyl-CoA hydratase [Sulfobacillus benefaciens]|uniref:Enoyl-CoA hydratase domain-containing protein 3, mitochondrial n=1 Tax=Sulfobacillus benefaciens TaxID=453960 RepID=A0A2T2XD00_9FIRM|nr:MAG: enoyl-CoA hydratase [Sulfobacillus benefaciens]